MKGLAILSNASRMRDGHVFDDVRDSHWDVQLRANFSGRSALADGFPRRYFSAKESQTYRYSNNGLNRAIFSLCRVTAKWREYVITYYN